MTYEAPYLPCAFPRQRFTCALAVRLCMAWVRGCSLCTPRMRLSLIPPAGLPALIEFLFYPSPLQGGAGFGKELSTIAAFPGELPRCWFGTAQATGLPGGLSVSTKFVVARFVKRRQFLPRLVNNRQPWSATSAPIPGTGRPAA